MGTSMFKNLSAAKAFGQNKWFTPGKYLVKITGVRFNEGGYKGDSFVVEGSVLACNNQGTTDDPKIGDTCAHVWNATGKKAELARNTWVGFLCAMLGCQVQDHTDEEWAEISAGAIDDEALNGQVALLDVWNKKTQDGGDFTYHAWRHIATPADYEFFGVKPS